MCAYLYMQLWKKRLFRVMYFRYFVTARRGLLLLSLQFSYLNVWKVEKLRVGDVESELMGCVYLLS